MVNIEKLKAKKNVKALIDLLSHKKEQIGQEASEALGALGVEASPALVTVLGDRLTPPKKRIMAARALGYTLDPNVIQPLIQGLLEEDDVSRECIGALLRFGSPIAPYLVHALQLGGQQTPHLLYIIGEFRDPSTLQTLLKYLPHDNPHIRKEAITALGKIGEPAVASRLMAFLGDPDPAIKAATITALAQLRHLGALPYLEQLLTDEQEVVRNAAHGAVTFLKQFL